MTKEGRNGLVLAVTVVGLTSILMAVSFWARSDTTSREGMVLERGYVRTQYPSETLDRGRVGTQASLPGGPQTWTGELVDAGCPDRSRLFLGFDSEGTLATQPGAPAAETTAAYGIAVSPQTAQIERGDALAHQVPDLRTRQENYACAVTGATRGFALVLPNGEVKNLDEGGNTFAMEAFEHSPRGEAVQDGTLGGAKPRASVTGTMRGDHIVADSVRLL